jgi:hypothetical protein
MQNNPYLHLLKILQMKKLLLLCLITGLFFSKIFAAQSSIDLKGCEGSEVNFRFNMNYPYSADQIQFNIGAETFTFNHDTTLTTDTFHSGNHDMWIRYHLKAGSSHTDTIHLHISPVPHITIAALPPIDKDDTAIYLGTYAKPTGGIWSCPDFPDAVFQYYFYPAKADTGKITLKYTFRDPTSDCWNAASAIISVSNTTGIVNMKMDQLKIYPNPFTGTLSIEYPEGHYSIRIIDLTGKNVYSFEDAKKKHIIHEEFIPGAYLLEIRSSKGMINKMIIAR